VRDETGAVLGEVTAVQNYGGGDILELGLGGRKGALIPFSSAAVPEVDVAAGFIRIDRRAAGLTEDEPAGEGPGEQAEGTASRKRGAADSPRGPRQAGGSR
jgi:16S rRNA processing protein RimM